MEDSNQTFSRVVNTNGLVDERLEGALLDPLLDVLLVVRSVLVAHAGVTDNESAHVNTLDEDVVDVFDGVGVRVVLRDKTANNNTTKVVQSVQSSRHVLTTDVLVVDVDTVRSQAGKSISGLLVLVVEAAVEAQFLGDVLQLLVRSDTANDLETLVLGNLTNQLANSTACRRDEDGLTLLGLTDLIKRRVGGQTGHAQGTKVDTDVFNSQRVLKHAEGSSGLLAVQGDVLLNGDVADDDVALLVGIIVGADNLGDGAAVEGLVEVEGRSVGLNVSRAHTATHVRVEAGVERLHDDTVFGSGHVGVIGGGLDGKVLTGDGVSLGDLLEDKRLVGGHGAVYSM